MNLIIRGHPARRMTEREISRAEVEEVLSNPFQTHPGTAGSTVYTGHTASGRVIQVVVIEQQSQPGTFIVKTVFEKGSD